MIGGPYFVLVVTGVLTTGVMAGVFCAFSTLVMSGLAGLPPAQGVAAMSSVNLVAPRPAFMCVFLGTAVVSVMIAVVTFVVWPGEGKAALLVGSALYLFGSLVVMVSGGRRFLRPGPHLTRSCRAAFPLPPLPLAAQRPAVVALRGRGQGCGRIVAKGVRLAGRTARRTPGAPGVRTRGRRPWPIPRGS
ncbi:hypothetical protein [Streptomyces sp. NPDC047028]|uniref:anthrone oxygenase family protein n=1 Tax=Streptomyces sp. NPDC047028 TaxID=3155793 RepID=UPI00341105DA